MYTRLNKTIWEVILGNYLEKGRRYQNTWHVIG